MVVCCSAWKCKCFSTRIEFQMLWHNAVKTITYLVVNGFSFTWRMNATYNIAVQCFVCKTFTANELLIGRFNGTIDGIGFAIRFMNRLIDRC